MWRSYKKRLSAGQRAKRINKYASSACLGHPPLTMRHSNVEHHIFIRIWWNKRDEAEAKAARAKLICCMRGMHSRTTNTWRKWASIRAEVNAGTMRMWRKVKVERVSAHSEKEMHLFSVCIHQIGQLGCLLQNRETGERTYASWILIRPSEPRHCRLSEAALRRTYWKSYLISGERDAFLEA